MPRTCSVCTHEERHAIETALVERKSYRDIAGRFSVSKSALSRHAKEHLPELLAKAHRAEEAARADDLIQQIRDLQERTERLLDKAEVHGKWHSAFVGVGQFRQNLELLARLVGELQEAPQVQVNILGSEEWLQVRSAMVEVLAGFPEARAAVAMRLSELELEGAR